jgi:hypothetical protein
LIPSASYAVTIPLGDPSFEAYDVAPHNGGYAYSAPSGTLTGGYRPTSAWVDDLDSPPDGVGGPSGYYIQDDGNSNWMYNATYATGSVRPMPRTGSQAMHGLGYYNAQETGAVFEAGMTYTFSIWHQLDSDGIASRNGTWLYIFDGSRPFSEPNALAFALRTPAVSGVWTQISLSHTVLPGAPEIGKPVGVGFLPRSDTAVDDATLEFVPEPTTLALVGLGGVAFWAIRRRRD